MHLLTLSPLTEISHGLSYAACNLASLISIERASGPSSSEILTKWLTPTSFKLMMGSGLGRTFAHVAKLKTLWQIEIMVIFLGLCKLSEELQGSIYVHESGIKYMLNILNG